MKMLVLVEKITNRVHYALDVVLNNIAGVDYCLTDKPQDFTQYEGPKLHYGTTPLGNEPFLKAANLLFEHDISMQSLNTRIYQGETVLFPVYSQYSILPFDALSASFYLVSRYEEYLPYVPDSLGRFTPDASFQSENEILHKPIVEIWAKMLLDKLLDIYPQLEHREHHFNFLPTYDIDSAWAFRDKGLFRTLGGFGRDLLARNKENIKHRTRVLLNIETDPFDSYELQFALQKEYDLHPIYFILCGDYNPNDKSVSIRNSAFQNLIKQLGDHAEVGIHPSFTSLYEPERIEMEVARLSSVLNREITQSRFHFLHMTLPHSYQHLLDIDITDDYTMGYASQVGFRAGMSRPFIFFDLENDAPLNLTIHPFAVMDGTLRDYLNLDAEQALELTKNVIDEVKKVNGTFCYLTHNETLGGKNRWSGWPEMYSQMLEYAL